jgi:hypothetical protein
LPQRRHVGEHQTTDVMQRADGLRRRADAGDDRLDLVLDEAGEIVAKARLTDNEIRTVRRRLAVEAREIGLDLGEPRIEFVDRACIRSRERTDHAVGADALDQRRARHPQHGRCDHRNAQAARDVFRDSALRRNF